MPWASALFRGRRRKCGSMRNRIRSNLDAEGALHLTSAFDPKRTLGEGSSVVLSLFIFGFPRTYTRVRSMLK